MLRRDFISKIGAGVFGVTLFSGCGRTVDVLPLDSDFVVKAGTGPLRFGLMTDLHYADRSGDAAI